MSRTTSAMRGMKAASAASRAARPAGLIATMTVNPLESVTTVTVQIVSMLAGDTAFLLHDTYGFPFDLTLELAGEQGLGVDEQGFEDLMDQQRVRARSAAGRGAHDDDRERIAAFAEASEASSFTGYETLEQATAVASISTRAVFSTSRTTCTSAIAG